MDAAIFDAVNRVLRAQDAKERALALQSARRAAGETQKRQRAIDGVGRERLRIPIYAYNYWGARLGFQCWKDKKFLREFERDNPECRVDSGGTKETHVGWVPDPSKVKFHKSYS